jgi:regulatory protein
MDPKILHYCKYQERCHSEVRNKLYEMGFTSGEVERQLSELIENGVLNEERFARAFARGKFRMLHWSRDKIKQQLKLKKISDYCIRKGLSEINEDEYEDTLNKLLLKKYDLLRGTRSIPTKKAKLFRYMAQKGYERDLVMDAINNKIKTT